MRRYFAVAPILMALAGCVAPPGKAPAPVVSGAPKTRPVARPEARAAPVEARTAEGFDTTTATERAAAASAAGGRALGITVASLGNPATPGFWLETPLVSAPGPGRVEAPNGKVVKVDLIPIAGPEGAGSRISLAAMRVLGLPLTGLHEVKVFRE